jgi:hypothetical protein
MSVTAIRKQPQWPLVIQSPKTNANEARLVANLHCETKRKEAQLVEDQQRRGTLAYERQVWQSLESSRAAPVLNSHGDTLKITAPSPAGNRRPNAIIGGAQPIARLVAASSVRYAICNPRTSPRTGSNLSPDQAAAISAPVP